MQRQAERKRPETQQNPEKPMVVTQAAGRQQVAENTPESMKIPEDLTRQHYIQAARVRYR